MFKLDRTVFEKGKADSMSNNVDYWQNKSPQERLSAAWYLVCCGFRIPNSTSSTLSLDRTIFSCEKK